MIAALLILAAGAAAVPEPVPVNPSSWVRGNDMPWLKRLRTRTEVIDFTMEVDSAGRPVSCRINRSSGSPSIDERTCRLLVERASFVPPTDADGVPLASTFNNRLVWQIMNPARLGVGDFDPGVSRSAVRVASDGTVEQCREEQEGAPLWNPAPSDCEDILGRAPYHLARYAESYGTLYAVAAVTRPGEAPPPIAGATLLHQMSAELQFRANGRFIRCTPGPGENDPTLPEICAGYPPEVRTRSAAAERRVVHRRLYGVPREAR